VPLANLQSNGNGHDRYPVSAAPGPTDWQDVFGLDALSPGTLQKQEVAVILFSSANSTRILRVRHDLSGCGQPLEGGRVETRFSPARFGQQRYDLVHAGRGVDIAALHLDPIPLLKENGRAKVAIYFQS